MLASPAPYLWVCWELTPQRAASFCWVISPSPRRGRGARPPVRWETPSNAPPRRPAPGGSGDQMPTMRQVAVELRVDLNTVRRAYDELERLGAVTLVRGRGSFVAEPPPAMQGPAHQVEMENLARQTLAAAAALGVDPVALS